MRYSDGLMAGFLLGGGIFTLYPDRWFTCRPDQAWTTIGFGVAFFVWDWWRYHHKSSH